jgi:hypothetical protein
MNGVPLAIKLDKIGNRRASWEIVVWDWSDSTRGLLPFDAYKAAKDEGRIRLANAIANHRYEHVHLIGHSAGAKLIQVGAEELVPIYKFYNENPFIHLTFLDAYTPKPRDIRNYGRLQHYANHYLEHYVDLVNHPRGLVCRAAEFFGPTNEILRHALNFNITKWKSEDPLKEKGLCGHQWPRYWYEKSVTLGGFRYGYPLSLEGGYSKYKALAKKKYLKGEECPLTKTKDKCRVMNGKLLSDIRS